ncbi:MAG: septal ring factor EnvC (AmiA/AmiB activator) [Janthinobacterium sp.]|jgi:septal ring factor EnvC (AmiA/AmiB activator)
MWLLSVSLAHAAPATERSQQKTEAEAQRAGLQQKLTTLMRDIRRTESAKEDVRATLAESEEAISNANRLLRELAEEQKQIGLKLDQLAIERKQLNHTVDEQQKQLAILLREHYVAGTEDRIKLLLSGDNPNRINRDLQMLTYVSQAQARFLDALRANLRATEINEQQAQKGKDELDEVALEEHQQKSVLEQEKKRRAALLASLSGRLVAQRKEASNVVRDEQRMAALVDKLGQLIKEQAAAAAAAKLRQERLAQARAAAAARAMAAQAEAARVESVRQARVARAKEQVERARLAREKGKVPPPFKPEPIDADEPRIAQKRPEPPPPPEPALPAAEPVVMPPAPPDGAFAALRGKLRAPVAGQLVSRFGSQRGDGPSWKGIFIRATEGTDIKAVAAGRVVFSEWMRGFGNLIIVDHGGQYMSIYGNNQALLKRAGAVVKGGEAIASAGNSGGNKESGLYFELRHEGSAFDPASWIKF